MLKPGDLGRSESSFTRDDDILLRPGFLYRDEIDEPMLFDTLREFLYISKCIDPLVSIYSLQ